MSLLSSLLLLLQAVLVCLSSEVSCSYSRVAETWNGRILHPDFPGASWSCGPPCGSCREGVLFPGPCCAGLGLPLLVGGPGGAHCLTLGHEQNCRHCGWLTALCSCGVLVGSHLWCSLGRPASGARQPASGLEAVAVSLRLSCWSGESCWVTWGPEWLFNVVAHFKRGITPFL